MYWNKVKKEEYFLRFLISTQLALKKKTKIVLYKMFYHKNLWSDDQIVL